MDVSTQSQSGSLDTIKGRTDFDSKQKIESATFAGGPSEAAYSLCALITNDGTGSAPVSVEQGAEMGGENVVGIECAAFMLDVKFFDGVVGWRSDT